MAKQILNVGTRNNDKTGDTLRAGGLKIKANFDELYAALGDGTNISGGNLLRSGSYSDLRNLPDFKAISTSGSFYDLLDKPQLVTATAAPVSLVGYEGQETGQIAFDQNNLYISTADYDGTTLIWKYLPWGGAGTTRGYSYTHNQDPTTAGGFSLDNENPAQATVAYIATTDVNENDIHPFYQYIFDNNLSANLEVISRTNPQNRALFKVTGSREMTANDVEYYELDLQYILSTNAMTIGTGMWDLHFDFTGAASTGLFSFNGNSVTISNDDMDLITTRTSWDTDADIGLDAADDIWIDAQGDQLALSAANTVTINSRTSPMYDSVFGGNEQDFVGMWDGTTVTIYTIGGSTLDNLMAEYVSNSDRQIWLETSAGFVELITTDVAQNPGPAEYILTVSSSSPSAELNIISMKVWDNTQVYNSQWTFRRDGVTQIPGPIDFDTRTIDLHNGGNQTAQILQFNTSGYQAVITGPTPADGESAQRLIIQGQRATGQYAEGGDVYLWGGDADTNGGDIKIYAGDADSAGSGQGGYINIDGGNGYNYGGAVQITGGSSTENGGNVTISSGSGGVTHGSVFLQTPGYQWQFDTTGRLIIPTGGDIVDSTGTSVLGNGLTSNRFVSVPTTSTGAAGDQVGDIAFNGSYIYYCTGAFGGTTYNTNTVYGSISSTYAVAQGSIPMPTIGWTLTINGNTYNVTGDATYQFTYGQDAWLVPTDTSINYSNGTSVILTPPNNTHIWKRVAFSNDTW